MISDRLDGVLQTLRTMRRNREFHEEQIVSAIAELQAARDDVRKIEDALVPRDRVLAFGRRPALTQVS